MGKSIKESKLPIIIAGKKRRLIARLKHFGKTPNNPSASIAELRKQLHPFVIPKKTKQHALWLRLKWELMNTGKVTLNG